MKTKTDLSGPSGRTRTGKIAKLPQAIREELNARMADGEATEAILAWLNGEPEVRAHLEASHEGSPITADNLSRWRQGGFAGWVENKKMQESLEAMTMACADVDQTDQDELAHRIGAVLMRRMVAQMQAFDAMPEGTEKNKFWEQIVWSYIALQRTDLNHAEFRLERKKAMMSTTMLHLEGLSEKDPGP
jgi:uncharacterized protein DUF3486